MDINPTPISDEYFNRVKTMLTGREGYWTRVMYAVFSRKRTVLSGINKSVNFLRQNATDVNIIKTRYDGDTIEPKEVCLAYEGYAGELINLETTILGFMSFSGAAQNMREIVKAAGGKPVIDMSARHYPWQLIEELAYAAAIGGADGTSTRAGFNYVAKWLRSEEGLLKRHRPTSQPYEVGIYDWLSYGTRPFKLYGTLPHAAAAIVKRYSNGLYPSVIAGKMFKEAYPMVPLVLLIDYEGRELDVIEQAVKILGKDLYGIRLDTHGGRYFQNCEPKCADDVVDGLCQEAKWIAGMGVTVEAARTARRFLDHLGAKDTKIVLSSGFNAEKTELFTKKCPECFDAIGTGSWVDFTQFTADIYKTYYDEAWHDSCKAGRKEELEWNF